METKKYFEQNICLLELLSTQTFVLDPQQQGIADKVRVHFVLTALVFFFSFMGPQFVILLFVISMGLLSFYKDS